MAALPWKDDPAWVSFASLPEAERHARDEHGADPAWLTFLEVWDLDSAQCFRSRCPAESRPKSTGCSATSHVIVENARAAWVSCGSSSLSTVSFAV